MLKNAINWFEIPTTDLDRAIDFYQHMLATTLLRESMEGIQMAIFPADENAISGALVQADFLKPGDQGSVIYLNVEGFMDDAIKRAEEKGSTVLVPKTDIGENGFYAHVRDSEGNRVALHSY